MLNVVMVAVAVGVVWTLYMLGKYVLKPYLHMLRYKRYQGAIWIPFFPVLGAFKHAETAFQETGDENFYSKRSLTDNPGARFFIFNALDKCFLLLTDPALLQEFFLKQQHYVKEVRFIENKVRFLGQGVAFAEGHEWSRRRKIMAGIFHFSSFNKFIPKITDIVDREIAAIRGHDNYSFHAQELSALISGDTIVKTFFGIAFN
jgi:cytochrome P450